jgi:hypothetical protein
MVVDTLPGGGGQRRRYLAYDILFLNREGVMDLAFKVGGGGVGGWVRVGWLGLCMVSGLRWVGVCV